MREAVAAALHERRLSVNQRATRPFVFRGGGLLGTRARAWTIHDAVKHMDRRPEDGIYHLTNGTLAQWLDEEGAADLAALARHAVDAGRADRRKALEIFLLGTGLVARPRLKTRPKALDLGYAISGETVAGRIRLGRGRGRGYLYGELEPGAPWLEVQPRSFAGGSVDLAVTADTHTLQIDPDALRRNHRGPHQRRGRADRAARAAAHGRQPGAGEPVPAPAICRSDPRRLAGRARRLAVGAGRTGAATATHGRTEREPNPGLGPLRGGVVGHHRARARGAPAAGLAHPLCDAALADPARDLGRDPGAGGLRIGRSGGSEISGSAVRRRDRCAPRPR